MTLIRCRCGKTLGPDGWQYRRKPRRRVTVGGMVRVLAVETEWRCCSFECEAKHKAARAFTRKSQTQTFGASADNAETFKGFE